MVDAVVLAIGTAIAVIILAITVYLLTQLVDAEVRLESTLDADQSTVISFLLDLKNYQKLHPSVRSVESSCETTKDGVTTSTVTFVEKPSRSPVSVTYATTRNVWKSEGIQYIQHVAQLSGFTRLIFGGLASFDLTTMISKGESNTTKVEEVAKLRLPRFSKLIAVPAFASAEKIILDSLKKVLEGQKQQSFAYRVYAWMSYVYAILTSLAATVKSISSGMSGWLNLINKKVV